MQAKYAHFITSLPVGVRSIASIVPVCLSVLCLSARISQERHARNSRSFLYVLPVSVVDSFYDDNAIRYVPVAYPEFHSEGTNLTKF